MRLIDRLLGGVLYAPPSIQTEERRRHWHGEQMPLLRPTLRAATVIVAANAAEYIYAETSQENFDLRRDFPNLAPPFGCFWIEYGRPSRIRSEEHGDHPASELPLAVGALYTAEDARPDSDIVAGHGYPPAPDDARWDMLVTLWVEQEAGKVAGPYGQWRMSIDECGRVVGDVNFHAPADTPYGRVLVNHVISSYNALLFPCMLALSFMHARNVRVVENRPDLKTVKRAQRAKTLPPRAFRTLVIDPVKETLRRAGAEQGKTGLKRALHECRGHFAQYGPEYGRGRLFGKYSGLFWIPAHERGGTPDDRRADHDYRVKLPKKGSRE